MNEISLHILDIIQNSIAAGAINISVGIEENNKEDGLTVTISDDGCGMDDETVDKVQDPFTTSRTTRKVGLGIPLFRAGCLSCEGAFSIESVRGSGTVVKSCYRVSHIDRPPLGNLAETAYLLVAANPSLDFVFRHSVDGREYDFKTAEMKQVLGGVPLDEPGVQQWIKQYFIEAEFDLHGGAVIQ